MMPNQNTVNTRTTHNGSTEQEKIHRLPADAVHPICRGSIVKKTLIFSGVNLKTQLEPDAGNAVVRQRSLKRPVSTRHCDQTRDQQNLSRTTPGSLALALYLPVAPRRFRQRLAKKVYRGPKTACPSPKNRC